MNDTVEILDLHVRTIIGTNDWEREDRQDVLISVWLSTDTRKAGASDRIEDAINYRDVSKRIMAMAEESKFFLVEKLAEEIGRICIQEFGAAGVKVRVEKPGALRFTKTVAVNINRAPSDYAP